MTDERLRLYVGTYTLPMSFVQGQGTGIYTCSFDTRSGKLEKIAETAAENPSYLALHPSGKYLYAVNEISEVREPSRDAITAYALEAETGIPCLLNQQPCLGGSPCHVSVDPSGRFAYTAAYAGGDVTAYPIGSDGKVGAYTAHIGHARGEKVAHAHSITPTPTGEFALACDLGLDCIFIYRLDLVSGSLIPHGEIELATGSGPRHLDFHPNGRFVYVLHELNATLSVLWWEPATGTLQSIQTISTLPVGFSGRGWCADVHVHPGGRCLYASNRGDSSLVIYRVDEVSGKLSLMGFEASRGKTPRSFVLDPQGEWLLAANQDSGNVAVFRIEAHSGRLDYHSSLEIPSPVCLKLTR
jgi:6-phosphogluconolactonase